MQREVGGLHGGGLRLNTRRPTIDVVGMFASRSGYHGFLGQHRVRGVVSRASRITAESYDAKEAPKCFSRHCKAQAG